MRHGAFPPLVLVLFCGWIMVRAAEPPPLRGQVRDEAGPCPGVRVRVKGTGFVTETDKQGRFELPNKGSRITAAKSGYFIAGARSDDNPLTLRLRPMPKEDHPDYQWVDPHPSKERSHNCGNCHSEIFKEWAGSAHGRAGTNKHFLNLYDGTDWHGKANVGWSLLKEHPNGSAVCSACHAPTVPFSHAGFDDFRKLDGIHRFGIHCDYCHKIADAPVGKLGHEHGRFAYKLLRPKEGQLFFGPLDDVDRDEDVYSPLYSQSQYCASCHEGTVFGVKVYTTYSEWLESPARKQGKQCQGCHMTPTGKLDNIAPGKGGIKRDPMTLASHAMPGGSPEMLKKCLRLSVKLKRDKDTLRAVVETLATDVGHRVPTGFIDRNLILVIEALDGKGTRVPAKEGPKLPDPAGVGDPAKNNFAGLPGRFYAKLIEDPDGKSPIPFWRPPRAESDTRLVPDQPDRATWIFPAAEVKQVRVRLVYRRFFKVVSDTKAWPDNDIVVIDEKLAVLAEGREVEWKGPLER